MHRKHKTEGQPLPDIICMSSSSGEGRPFKIGRKSKVVFCHKEERCSSPDMWQGSRLGEDPFCPKSSSFSQRHCPSPTAHAHTPRATDSLDQLSLMKGSGVQLSPDRAHPSKGDDKKYSEKDVCKDRVQELMLCRKTSLCKKMKEKRYPERFCAYYF